MKITIDLNEEQRKQVGKQMVGVKLLANRELVELWVSRNLDVWLGLAAGQVHMDRQRSKDSND